MVTPNLTPDRLRELLDYDQATGVFRWKKKRSRNTDTGFVAGYSCPLGYKRIRVDRHLIRAHRLAWLYVYGEFPIGHIDHIDGRPDNNAIANLRIVTPEINSQNQRRAHSNNRLGILGVKKIESGRYWARITAQGRTISLGMFDNPDDARSAYIEAKRRLHDGCTI